MAPYRFPNVAEAFRGDRAADSGAPTSESEQPIPEDGGSDSGGTTNPVFPRPGANRRRRTGPDAERTPVSIRFPGPDLAGFPNSSFTLPMGRFYLESDPLAYYAPSKYRNLRYNWEFLLNIALLGGAYAF